MDGHSVGWARKAAPVLIHLKDPSWFPHQKQYPLKPEIKEGLILIIRDLKRLKETRTVNRMLQPI
jgi:hypothetical protein